MTDTISSSTLGFDTHFQDSELLPTTEFITQFDNEDEDGEDDAVSFFFGSTNVTPNRRTGVSFTKAKRWLATWLKMNMVDLYHCHATKTLFLSKQIEFAHILVPKCGFRGVVNLSKLEFCLGMDRNSLCIHSRLFLMPLQVSVHRSLDAYHLLLLPSKDKIQLATSYLERYKADILSEDPQRMQDRPWSKLRVGMLEPEYLPLRAGTKHKYLLLPSPYYQQTAPPIHVRICHDENGETLETETWCSFPYPFENFPEFESHTSPFAVLVNTLRALEEFDSPGRPQALKSKSDYGHTQHLQRLVHLALLRRHHEDQSDQAEQSPELNEHAESFAAFAAAFHIILGHYQVPPLAASGRPRSTGSPSGSHTSLPQLPPPPPPPTDSKPLSKLLNSLSINKLAEKKGPGHGRGVTTRLTLRARQALKRDRLPPSPADQIRDKYLALDASIHSSSTLSPITTGHNYPRQASVQG